jgi:hypothetical protein
MNRPRTLNKLFTLQSEIVPILQLQLAHLNALEIELRAVGDN